jgi:AraC-like DNA-binding protein
MNLKTFNYYQYLKEKLLNTSSEKYLLVDSETYQNHGINFPFRATHYGIGINYGKGEGICKIGSTDYSISEGNLITIGPGIVSQWQGEYNSKNETIFFNEGLFSEINVTFLKTLPFFLHGGNHVINISNNDLNKMIQLFQCIKSFIKEQGVVSGLVFSMLKYVRQLHSLTLQKVDVSIKEQITLNFKEMLAKHFIETKEVGFYASKLNITPKYLSEVLLTATGKSAKELINEHITWEAKSLLKQTGMTVQEISYWLGYEDLSYFVRMFKKNTKMTPIEYRNT